MDIHYCATEKTKPNKKLIQKPQNSLVHFMYYSIYK